MLILTGLLESSESKPFQITLEVFDGMYATELEELPIMTVTDNVAVGAELECKESFRIAAMVEGYVTRKHDLILSTQTWVSVL